LGKTDIPESEVLTSAQLQEDKEGKLVTVKDVTVESYASGNYKSKASNPIIMDLMLLLFSCL